jgi:RHS repeat-associated protein
MIQKAKWMENYFIKIKNHFGQSMFDQLVTEFAQQSNLYVDEIKVDEFHIYGSSRLGVYESNKLISKRVARDLNLDNQITSTEYVIETPEEVTYLFSSYQLERGAKRYELSNHLGNVLTVISDKKTAICTGNTFNYFAAERISATDYSPFGAPLASRSWNGGEYRFGFNSMENDNEINGTGNAYDFGARIYDSRLGRWMSVDPHLAKYPSLSPYNYCANNPIIYVDKDGRDYEIIIDKVNKTITISTTFYTDSKISSERMCEAANSIMNKNGKFSFKTDEGEEYKINFNITVLLDHSKDASATAVDDPVGNSLSVLDNKTYDNSNPDNGLPSNGIAKYGGDKTEVREENLDSQDELDVTIHESLHSLGIDHSLIGLRGSSLNKRVLKSILHFAGRVDDEKIKVKGGKDSKTLLSQETSGEYRRPSSRIRTTDGSNVKLSGKVVKTKN